MHLTLACSNACSPPGQQSTATREERSYKLGVCHSISKSPGTLRQRPQVLTDDNDWEPGQGQSWETGTGQLSKVVQAEPEDFVGDKPATTEMFQHEGLMETNDLVLICLRHTGYHTRIPFDSPHPSLSVEVTKKFFL